MLEQGLELGSEEQPAVLLDVVAGLLSHAVACDQQPTAWLVPYRKREHAVQEVEAADAVLFVEVRDRLAVGPGAELVTGGLQTVPQLGEVVDLAVQHQPDRAVLVRERLMAALDVDDREAPEPESDRRAGRSGLRKVVAVVVRSAMPERGRHPFEHGAVYRPGRVDDSADPAHGLAAASD